MQCYTTAKKGINRPQTLNVIHVKCVGSSSCLGPKSDGWLSSTRIFVFSLVSHFKINNTKSNLLVSSGMEHRCLLDYSL